MGEGENPPCSLPLSDRYCLIVPDHKNGIADGAPHPLHHLGEWALHLAQAADRAVELTLLMEAQVILPVGDLTLPFIYRRWGGGRRDDLLSLQLPVAGGRDGPEVRRVENWHCTPPLASAVGREGRAPHLGNSTDLTLPTPLPCGGTCKEKK